MGIDFFGLLVAIGEESGRRVMDITLKYGMTVDRDEAGALEGVLSACDSTRLIKASCAD